MCRRCIGGCWGAACLCRLLRQELYGTRLFVWRHWARKGMRPPVPCSLLLLLLVACGEGESLGAVACDVYAVGGNLGCSALLQYEEQLLALVVHGYNMYLGNVFQLAAGCSDVEHREHFIIALLLFAIIASSMAVISGSQSARATTFCPAPSRRAGSANINPAGVGWRAPPRCCRLLYLCGAAPVV